MTNPSNTSSGESVRNWIEEALTYVGSPAWSPSMEREGRDLLAALATQPAPAASQAASHSAPEPAGYLIDPGAGSAMDRVQRDKPSESQMSDIQRRGGSVTPLVPLGAESKACASVGVEPSINLPDMPDLRWHAEYRRGFAQCLSQVQELNAALASPTPSVGEPIRAVTADEHAVLMQATRDGATLVAKGRLVATPPAAPAATEAPTKPFAYYIHIAAEQRGEFVHNLDEALDDLTNCDCKITELFDHATPAPAVGASEREEGFEKYWVARADFDKMSGDLTRAKNLLVRLWDKHPAARAQPQGRPHQMEANDDHLHDRKTTRLALGHQRQQDDCERHVRWLIAQRRLPLRMRRAQAGRVPVCRHPGHSSGGQYQGVRIVSTAQEIAEWARDGIADFVADNWADRKYTLDEIEKMLRSVEINTSKRYPERATPAPGAPAGFKLVPIEATPEMITAGGQTPGIRAIDGASQMHQLRGNPLPADAFATDSPLAQAWRAMLDAAPGAPGQEAAAVQAVGAWQDIATAPKDNARLLYLARFDRDGDLVEIDFDGIWESYSEHLDGQLIADGFIWQSANGIEEPTHWAYQDGPPPVAGIVVSRAALMEIAKDLDHICAHGDAGSQETAHDARDVLRAALPPSGAGEVS